MKLTNKISQRNFLAFIWHTTFFALAFSFMDVDTVMPAMLLKAGGTNFHIGLLTTILMGGNWFAQIFFAPILYNRPRKKPFLLLGIGVRVMVLFAFAYLFLHYQEIEGQWFIFILLSLALVFAVSGSFAGVSYTDILGKSILQETRKRFFSIKQVIFSIGIFGSAFAVKKLLQSYAFPANYFGLFFLAATFLLLASLGFFGIREIAVAVNKINGLRSYFYAFKKEFETNPKLLPYLLTINTLGVGISMLPFVIAFIKQTHGLNGNQVGNLLIFKTLGLIFAGVSLFLFSKKFKYRQILLLAFFLSFSMLILIIFFANSVLIFPIVFFMGGMFFSLFSISKSGILLEISNNQNRPLYAGMAGAGSILITLFPALSGLFIELIGFQYVFGITLLILMTSLFFIRKLDCKK